MQSGALLGDRFEIEALAGAGGMGSVYRALDRAEGATVAVKVLGGHIGEKERFAREARILADLRHPHIVRYIAGGETPEGRPYLVMEWLEGEDLEQRLERGPLAAAEAVSLVRRVADALGEVHRRGIVHRDVKPSNIFICRGDLEQIRVLDFGIARVSAAPRTRTGAVLGSPGYLAPEQARGSRQIDARTDVFSLGCVLFACLAGRPPYVGDDLISLLARVILEEPPRVSAAWPDVPPALDELAARMMSIDPERRPRDGADAARALEALGELPRSARALSVRSATLTADEQRLRCVVLVEGAGWPAAVAGADAATVGLGETLEVPDDHAALAAIPAVAARFHGRVEALPAGARLILFEGGGVATDLAVRAARCALALRGDAGDRRVAAATGRGSTTGSALGGEAAERALHLLRAAAAAAGGGRRAGLVLVDEATQGLLGDRFAIERAEEGLVLVGERGAPEAPRRAPGEAPPCIGRDRELRTLEALFDECTGEPIARAALLTGAAGAGKSRLAQELLRRIRARGEPVEVWYGRGDPMSAGSPFDLLGQAIRGAAGISGAEPLEERRERLARRVARRVGARDAARVARFLGEIAGVPFEGGADLELSAARQDAVLMADQTCRAVLDLCAAECSSGPLVLVLEDLHWGDLPTVKVVDALLRTASGAPLFVLGTARPEVRGLFPALWEGRDIQEIRVGALTPKASERLVRHVLGDAVPREVIDRIVARAAGHPLHLEELLRAVADRGDDTLPDSVLAMVQARIEALEPEARRVLRAASVFGRTSWAGGVSALLTGGELDSDTAAWIEQLVEREWIVRRDASRFPRDQELAFRLDVARDAAYAMLTEVDRALGHRLAGEWLEAAGEDSGLVLARHFELGGDRARAIAAHARAAEQLLDGDDPRAVIEHGERAAALGAAGPELGRVRALEAEARALLGEIDAARAKAIEAMSLLEPADPAWYRAAGAAVHASGKLGDVVLLEALVRDLLALDPAAARGAPFASALSQAAVHLLVAGRAELAGAICARLEALGASASTDPAVAGHTARAIGVRAIFAGDVGMTLASLRTGIAAFEAAGDLRSACSLKKTHGFYASECGALEEGEQALREAIAVLTRMGLAGQVIHAKHDLGSPLVRLGKHAEAAALQEEAIVAFAAQGDHRLESYAHGYLSWIRRLEGDHAAAEREARRALEVASSPPVKVSALAYLSAALLAGGSAAEALEMAAEGVRLLEQCGVTEEGAALLHLTHAEALHAVGRRAEARAVIAAARGAVLARGARLGDESLRATFLGRIAENARTLELAAEWLGGA